MLRRLALLLTLVPCFASAASPEPRPLFARPAAHPSDLCESATADIEARQGLPARVLHAISLRESGRADPATGRVRPWPWTINYQGMGRFFETREEAIAAVRQIQASGGQSIDVGCMQVNLLHHPTAFASLEEAFEPTSNAAYAARFLRSLLNTTGGEWGAAIAAYHSRTPGVGETYRDQVLAAWNPSDPSLAARLGTPASPLAPAFPMVVYPAVAAAARPAPVVTTSWHTSVTMIPIPASAPGQVGGGKRDANGRDKARPRTQPLDLKVSFGLPVVSTPLVTPKGVATAAPNVVPVKPAKSGKTASQGARQTG